VFNNRLFHFVYDLWTGNNVLNTDSHTSVYQPVVHHKLNVRQDVTAGHRPDILPHDVDQTTGRVTHIAFLQETAHQLTLLYADRRVCLLVLDEVSKVRIGVIVDFLGDNKTDDLLASP
jgi:hypothetical protein